MRSAYNSENAQNRPQTCPRPHLQTIVWIEEKGTLYWKHRPTGFSCWFSLILKNDEKCTFKTHYESAWKWRKCSFSVQINASKMQLPIRRTEAGRTVTDGRTRTDRRTDGQGRTDWRTDGRTDGRTGVDWGGRTGIDGWTDRDGRTGAHDVNCVQRCP